MRLVMTLLARDEADVVRENIDYHLSQGIDFVVATDNRSKDGTTEILREYESEGVLRLLLEPGNYSQGPWTTRMARLAATDHAADWVIPNDPDEFWLPREGTLRDVIEGLPAGAGALSAPRSNFLPRPDDGQPFWERMTVRERRSLNPRGKPLPPKLARRAHPQMVVPWGNHRLEGPQPGDLVDDAPIEILHFPMRTYPQFARSVRQIGRAYRRNKELGRGTGAARRRLFRLWRRGELPAYWDERATLDRRDPEAVTEDTRLRDHMRLLYGPRSASSRSKTSGRWRR